MAFTIMGYRVGAISERDVEGAAIVVAHPDDEVLWFSSLLNRVAKIVVCYGEHPLIPARGDQRRKVVSSYPLSTLRFLDIAEPRHKPHVDGVESVGSAIQRPRDRSVGEHESDLLAKIRAQIVGCRMVFAHSPWGEYGHNDHKRVHKIVAGLASDLKLPLFVPNYAGVAALGPCGEALRGGIRDVCSGVIDHELTDSIKSLYLQNKCWTWKRDWKWPKEEKFYQLGDGTVGGNEPVPLHVFVPPWQKETRSD